MQTEFFDHLYEHCDGFIEFRTLPSGEQRHFLLKQKERMQKFYKQHSRENLHFGVATRDGKGGTKKILSISPLFGATLILKTSIAIHCIKN